MAARKSLHWTAFRIPLTALTHYPLKEGVSLRKKHTLQKKRGWKRWHDLPLSLQHVCCKEKQDLGQLSDESSSWLYHVQKMVKMAFWI